MNKDKIWNIVLIISIILIIYGLTKTGSADKKEAQAGQNEVALGTIGAGISIFQKRGFWAIFTPTVVKAMIIPLTFLIAFLPNMIGNFINLFRQPTIPNWIYVAGFVVLLMMVTGRKR